MRKVDIYTDGSYSRVDKTGGYGAVIIYKGSNNNGTRDEIRGSFIKGQRQTIEWN